MSGDGGSRKGRYHLVLSVNVWAALVAEARRRRIRVSHLVQERLVASLAITGGGSVQAEVAARQPVEKGNRHHCRLSMDSRIWDCLAREAAKQGVSVTEIVRQRLRQAVLGQGLDMGWQARRESVNGASVSRAPEESEVEPKSITMLEL